MPDELKRIVVWKNLLLDGRDHCGLWHTADGWLLKGTVGGVLKDQRPMLASYEIHCDEKWLTHRVQVERTIGSDVKTLSLNVESRGAWRSSGEELRGVLGCHDVDLALTPATNTLPTGPHCSTSVPTLHADDQKHLSLRKQYRVLGGDRSR